MNDTNDALARAINHLGAVQVAPNRIAMTENGRWFVMNERDFLTVALDREEAYSGRSVLMPPWWSPERREVCAECKHPDAHTDEVCYCPVPGCNCDRTSIYGPERITASLETGEEVTA